MKIIRGKIPCAQKVVVYGPEGIGKSTFAAQFPEPLFIDTEGSTKHMDVARLPKPTSWPMLFAEIQDILKDPSVCKTLIIDTVDWAEMLCISNVCDKYGKTGIEDFGYGKGYIYVTEEFGKFLNKLEEVVEHGINVVLTAHAKMRKFEQPDEMGAYDRWELKLTDKSGKSVGAMVKEWADMVLFATYKTIVVKTEDKKAKAQGGKRIMYTAHHPCWDAKNRHGLADELPFSYAEVAHIFAEPTAQARPSAEKPPAAPVTPQTQPAAEPGIPPDENPFEEEIPESIPRELADLMRANRVLPSEIEMIVWSKGYMPSGMPLAEFPEDFVQEVLIAAWPTVFAAIEKDRTDVPF